MPIVVTFGTFDLFHVGHVRVLERSARLGTLVVGISSDAFTEAKKGRLPVYPETHRMEIVASMRGVERVFLEHSFEAKRDYLIDQRADILTMGDDWQGRFDHYNDIVEVIYLPRTPEISTTEAISSIRSNLVHQ